MPSVVSLSDAWILNVNEFRMLQIHNYLPPIFHPGLDRIDGVVVYLQEFITYEVLCTKPNLCHKIITAMNKNNQCFVVLCLYISPSFKHSLKMKEVELLLWDESNLLVSPVSISGNMNSDLLKQFISLIINQIYCSSTEMKQLLTTTTRITIDSATLIDQGFLDLLCDNLAYCGIPDASLTYHCATLVELPFSCKKRDDTGTT